MKVVLAEKPSVARDIAAVLGAATKKDGYFEGNGYIVTYAFGHLVTIAEPEEMNPSWGSPWRMEQLPMLPDSWKYRIAPKAGTQFNIIKRLLNDSKTQGVICATDAGREGEHIFRLIYMLSGCRKPVERLWISSLTPEAIKDGFSKLQSSTEFDNLAAAASGRAHADWLVGLNFTRAYTTMNRQLCTIGRVQTPTLALIVERQNAIDSFVAKDFYEIIATFEPGFTSKYITPGAEPQTRLEDKAKAKAILDEVKPIDKGLVESVATAEKRTKAPALYDLLTLQKDANKKFGYTAQETLDIAQSLYEEYKLISYPRTESRHISSDMVDQLPRIVSGCLKGPAVTGQIREAFAQQSIVPGKITTSLLKPSLTKAYVDDTKLTDHHAIIPTYKDAPEGLPQKQFNIYQLVALRFLSIFLPAEVRDETTVIIKLAEHSFRAKGVVIKDPGWTVVQAKSAEPEKKEKGKDKQKDAEETQELPQLAKGQEVPKKKVELKESKTSPPKPYDDASLLTAMKNAGQVLDDEDLAAYMKQKGLGTPATRAAIIERLLHSGYIERNKKSLVPTAKGKAIIAQVHGDLKDVALTASWEQKLADMQEGNLQLNTFETEIADFIKTILPKLSKAGATLPPAPGSSAGKNGRTAAGSSRSSNGTAGDAHESRGDAGRPDPGAQGGKRSADEYGPCPQCKQGVVLKTPKGAGCNRWREDCKFSIWGEQYGKQLTDSHIKELLKKRRTGVIKGFKKKDGSGKYDACLVLNDEFKVRLELPSLEESAFGPCPQCKQGLVRKTPKGAGCSRWKEGCGFSIWREQNGKEISDTNIKEIVETGRSKTIKGFKKKDGTGTFDAQLVLSDRFKIQLLIMEPVRSSPESAKP